MKKMLFAAIAAFVMSISLSSCGGSSSPQDQMLGCMQEMVDIMKSTSIKSVDDAKALKEKIQAVQEKVEKVTENLTDDMKNMSEEEQEKYLKKIAAFEQEGQAEVERLQKEAEAIGIDLDDL